MFDFEEKINRYMEERTRVNLKEIYEQLKEQYPIVLTNTFSLDNGEEEFGEDFDVLCGESSAGKFYLYDDGLYIVFDVDKADGTYLHWHPENTEEACDDLKLFMKGICKY